MAASAGAVRAGGAFVEIFAKDGAFQQAMTRVQNRMKAVAATMNKIGSTMGLSGAAMAAPMVMALNQAAGFQDAILGIKASTNLAGREIDMLRAKAEQLSREMKVAPSSAAKSFLALVKAGVDVEEVLGDAGKAAIQFGRLAPEINMEDAANGMSRAKTAFGVSFREIVDTVAAAADTTETNVGNISNAFNVVAPLAASLGQDLAGTTQALAMLAKSGMEGEEAGTALKMFLLSLTNATPEAQKALASLGLTTESFRNQATRNLLPIADIATMLMEAIKKVDPAVADAAIATVFGARGIKSMKAFEAAGTQGMAAIAKGMEESRSVAEKFDIIMSGVTGTMEGVRASVERLSGSFANALGSSLQSTADKIVAMVEAANEFVSAFPAISRETLDVALNLLTLSVAIRGVGVAISTVSVVRGLLPKVAGLASKALLFLGAGPVVAAVGGVVAAIAGVVFLLRQISPAAKNATDALVGMGDAAGKGKKQSPKVAAPQKANVNISNMMTPEERAIHEQIVEAKNKLNEQRQVMEDAAGSSQNAAAEAMKAAAEEEQAFDDAQQKAIDGLQELSNSVVSEVEGMGESAFNAAVNLQNDIRDVMSQVEAGILNPEGAKVLGDRIKQQFEADMEAIRKGTEEVVRDFGTSSGTFGSGEGLGIASELSKITKQVKIELKKRPPKPEPMPQFMEDDGGSANRPNPAWVKQQEERRRKAAEASSAVGNAAAAQAMPALVRSLEQAADMTRQSSPAVLPAVLPAPGNPSAVANAAALSAIPNMAEKAQAATASASSIATSAGLGSGLQRIAELLKESIIEQRVHTRKLQDVEAAIRETGAAFA